ncbi:MAG TPA: phosphoglucosamine mutase [Pyrinomonadaceae bacterium]|jgi:phosphoglucosamine mutase
MKKLFGTDGMRGEAGQFPLDAEIVKIVGASLARQFSEKNGGKTPKFIIGRDTRESGAWLEAAFREGAASEGATVVSAGVITTPGVAFLTRDRKADAGVVVSASHNPFHDNGIKIFSASGKKIDEKTERQIEADIETRRRGDAENNEQRTTNSEERTTDELRENYLNYLASEFPRLSLTGLKMVVDCANGAASDLAPNLFERFGANVTAIYNQPDGKNINADCGSLHLEKLQAKVVAEKADFGVAYDGDADRALFVDEKGNIVDGDATLWAMALHLKSGGLLAKNLVVATVMSNLGLEIALKGEKIELIRTAVGDKYVLDKLLETGAAIGGEQSGHIIFPQKSLVGDGMLTTLALLDAMRENRATLSELNGGFVRYPQILVNVRVREKIPFEDVPEIRAEAENIENALGERGRLLLRYSGTEPLARVMIEGEKQDEITRQANDLAKIIREKLAD